MTEGRIYVIYNPVAGTTDADTFRALLEERCASRGQAYELRETQEDDDPAELARAALGRGITRFAAAGGDGTVSAVAHGLVDSGAVLGILPAGTANVLAAELGVPADMGEAIDLLLAAPATRKIGAMRVEGRHYLLHVGVGITSLIHRDTDREQKRRFGRLAYIVTGARWLINFQPARFTIVADGVRHRRDASQVLIANGGALGGTAMRWAEKIDPADGRVDVCVLYAIGLRDYLRFGLAALIGRQSSLGRMTVYPARRQISLNTRRPLPVQADGELVGTTPVQIEVVREAVEIIVPEG